MACPKTGSAFSKRSNRRAEKNGKVQNAIGKISSYALWQNDQRSCAPAQQQLAGLFV